MKKRVLIYLFLAQIFIQSSHTVLAIRNRVADTTCINTVNIVRYYHSKRMLPGIPGIRRHYLYLRVHQYLRIHHAQIAGYVPIPQRARCPNLWVRPSTSQQYAMPEVLPVPVWDCDDPVIVVY